MSLGKLLSLTFVTVIVLAAAWFVSERNAPQTELSQAALYPGLIDRVNDVTSISIRSAGRETQLENRDGVWVVSNRGSYPALFENIKRLVVNVADLSIIEGKTRRPQMYHRLQVEPVDEQKSRSIELVMRDADGTELAALLVGKTRSSSIPGDNDAFYVRKRDEEQAQLVAGALGLTARTSDWMNATVADFEADDVKRIVIQHQDGHTLEIVRDSADVKDYRLANLPADMKVKSMALLTSLATAMNDLRFDEVQAANQLTLPAEPVTKTRFETFSGLNADISHYLVDDLTWSTFRFSGSGEQASVATALNAELAPWAYVLPEFKRKMLTRRADELMMPRPEKTPQPAPQ